MSHMVTVGIEGKEENENPLVFVCFLDSHSRSVEDLLQGDGHENRVPAKVQKNVDKWAMGRKGG